MPADRPSPRQWREQLLAAIAPPRTVRTVPLEQARGLELAAPVHSPAPVPSAPIAAMDGFAVRRADLTAPGATTLPVASELPARPGAVPEHVPGTATRIMTGALVPLGADAVVEVERSDSDPFGPAPSAVTLTLDALPPENRHVRGIGEEVADGQLLADAGDLVGAGLIGLARTLGIQELAVRAPLRVAVVVTGDELADPANEQAPEQAQVPGTVRESNGAMLAAALQADGADVLPPRRGSDDPERLRTLLAEAAEDADLVITTGGIGHGAFDVVKALLGERGEGTSRFAHVTLRPGGPQGYGHLPGGTPVIHLPGTPVGALVGHHLFVRPLLVGERAAPRRVLLGDTSSEGSLRPGAVHALAGRLRRDEAGREVVDLVPGRRLAPYGRADALVLLDGDAQVGDGASADRLAHTALVIPLPA